MRASIILIFIITLCLSNSFSQVIVINNAKGFTANEAASYSKDFSEKFRNHNAWIGNFQSYIFSLQKWDVIEVNGGYYYRVFVSISWIEVDGLTRLNYSYEGAFTFDQFGCNAFFWITEKTEHSLLGVGCRTFELTDTKATIQSTILPGANWGNALEGCLELN